ncbi:UDP-N-acetylglucosamine 2-epimerase [Gammaproteobacteria bacterium]|nr:UDP-N-acetylglucosamine 2-epimerase [Gammaproteobacteria bacterium]
MEHKKKICVVTGSRAEYGLLHLTMLNILKSDHMELGLVVTGSHLSEELGHTFKEIEGDGFIIDFKIPILNKEDTSIGVLNSMSEVFTEIPKYFKKFKPDLILVLGDRYEIFASVSSALISKIPVAHIHGGELTEGAFDESMRHAITKMSHLHFTTTEDHKRRVIQLGEIEENVFNVGAPGVEKMKSIKLLKRQEIQEVVGIPFKKNNYLITYHPETLNDTLSPVAQIRNLLTALRRLKESSFIFTKANSDPGGIAINNEIEDFVRTNPLNSCLHSSLGHLNYLSAMKYSTGVIGNSSSALIESPTLKCGAVNIGNRQNNRTIANNIISCENNEDEILKSILMLNGKQFQDSLKKIINPYDGGRTSKKIVSILKNKSLDNLIIKRFNDI